MKIVQVINSLVGGGAERVVLALAQAFAKYGHESIIVVFEEGGDFNTAIEGVEILHRSLDIAKGAVLGIEADLILAHMKTPHRLFKQVYLPNLYFVVHNTQSMRLQKHFYAKLLYPSRVKRLRRLYENHRIITVSEGVAKDLVKTLQVQPESIKTIYNPFAIADIQMEANVPIPFKKPYILNVAGLRPAKRQDILLHAYAKGKFSEDLVILGEGSWRTKLQKLARSLGIEKRVHFLGWQNNPYAWMKRAKLFVLSSDFEGFGNVLVESLIVHTPVVSTDCPSGPAEILTGVLSPYLAKKGDVNDLTIKMQLALKSYPRITHDLYSRFDDLKIAKDYLKLVDEV
jgi:glycosyltransferase involved in cell wall biosynthesis